LVYAADGRPIGTKKTMVFYRGRAPAGAKTKWKLNEYKAFEYEHEDDSAPAPPPSHALQVIDGSICQPIKSPQHANLPSLMPSHLTICNWLRTVVTRVVRAHAEGARLGMLKGALLFLFVSADEERVQPVPALHQVRVPAAVRPPA